MTDKRPWKMYVWSDKPRWIAVAHAMTIEDARQSLQEDTDLGESGDGTCPVHDEARRFILSRNPVIWQRENAEFAITDSSAVEEADEECSRLRKRITALEAEVARLRAALLEVAVPLEVLTAQIQDKPYKEITRPLQDEICSATFAVREALLAAHPAEEKKPYERL